MADTPGPPHVATLVLIQVVGAEALHGRVPAAFARGLALLERLVGPLAAETGGTPAASAADGTLIRFEDVAAAVRFAARLQLDALGLDWPPTLLVRPEASEQAGPGGAPLYRGLRLRVGIHLGRFRDGPGGVEGPGVYQVARLAGAAAGGQCLLGEGTWAALGGAVPEGLATRDLGPQSLVGLDGSQRLYQVLPQALDARDFPPLRPRSSNLSGAEEPALGRQGDLAALAELVGMGVRLVTVLGPPGVGKSRLCRQFARSRLGDARLPGGVWFCQPRQLGLAGSLASALGVPLDTSASEAAAADGLGHALGARGPSLVVVDGLAAADAPTVESWMRQSREVVFVVNAADRLRLPGEIAYQLGPLGIPAQEGDRHADAVRFYESRARGVDEDFGLEDTTAVGEIVARLGGVPLSIRLLAGVVDRMPPSRQVEGLRSGAVHPESLFETVWGLLDGEEQQVLAACASLSGTFEALAVTGPDDDDATPVVERLERRGLVRPSGDLGAPHVRRYTLDGAVRDWVLARLSPEDRRLMADHRALGIVAACEPWASGPATRDRPEVVARLAVEWAALEAAMAVGIDPSREEPEMVDLALRAALALRPILESRGPLYLGLDRLDAVIRRSDQVLGSDPLLQLRVLVLRASCLRRAGRVNQALPDLDRAEAIAERWSDQDGAGRCLLERGSCLWELGHHENALRAFRSSEQDFDAIGDAIGAAVARSRAGAVALAGGRLEEGEAQLTAAAAVLRAEDARLALARCLSWLALSHRRQGRADEARATYREVIRLLRECGRPGEESRARSQLGALDIQLDLPLDAERIVLEAVQLARSVGDRDAEAAALRQLGGACLADGRIDVAREHLLNALAIHRDRGDRASEGSETAMLALIHHLDEHPDSAREGYRRALALLDDATERRVEAMVTAWLAALEAEHGPLATARTLMDVARIKQAESGDPQVAATLDQIAGIVDLAEADAAEDAGDAERASALRDAVRRRHAAVAGRGAPLPLEGRLAHARVGRALEALSG